MHKKAQSITVNSGIFINPFINHYKDPQMPWLIVEYVILQINELTMHRNSWALCMCGFVY